MVRFGIRATESGNVLAKWARTRSSPALTGAGLPVSQMIRAIYRFWHMSNWVRGADNSENEVFWYPQNPCFAALIDKNNTNSRIIWVTLLTQFAKWLDNL